MKNATYAQSTSMGSLVISMVKNEADIIEASIRHNLNFVDLIAVIDNGSTDGTRAILEALRDEGLPVLIFDDPVFGHFQSEKVTEVYRRVVPIYQPDLVYLLDADEFIRTANRAALEYEIGQVSEGGLALLPWETHIPDPLQTPAQMLEDPIGSSPCRRRCEEPVYYKAVIRRRAEDDLKLVIEQGNHSAHLSDGTRLSATIVQEASVVHLPVRSLDQISAKVVNGWLACVVRNRTRNVPGEAYQWQTLYDRITRGGGITTEDLTTVALDYAQTPRAGRTLERDAVRDPVDGRYGCLRYLGMAHHDPLAKVALGVAQHLAGEQPSASSEDSSDTDAMDLAAVMYVLDESQAKTLIVADNTARQDWERAVLEANPQLRLGSVNDANALIATRLSGPEAARLMIQLKPTITQRVIYWLPAGYDAESMRQHLEAWEACGWGPDIGLTMALRALACFGEVRRGGLVLRPFDSNAMARVKVVRDVLCGLAQQPMRWNDPVPQCVRHPLQNITLSSHVSSGVREAIVSTTPAPGVTRRRDNRPSKMRVAVITPYYKEPRDWLQRCLDSVKAQDHDCVHFLISDGYPQSWLNGNEVRHIQLDTAHDDYGNTPRSIGAQLAVAEGFDAIAFLDADNWYSSEHISSCVNAAIESAADYVVAGRTFNRADGSILPWLSREDELGEHVDTSCFFILRGAFHTLPRWLLMPKPMSILGDRYYLKSLRDEGLREVKTDRKTVRYLCSWADVYKAVGEEPPSFAKGSLPLEEVSCWMKNLSTNERQIVEKLSGCRVGPNCQILINVGA